METKNQRQKTIKIIQARINTDQEQWIYDAAITETMQEYWDWCNATGAKVNFTVRYADDETNWHAVACIVEAHFKKVDEAAQFMLQYANLPKTQFDSNSTGFKFV